MHTHSRKKWRKRTKNHELMGAMWMIGMGVLFITGAWWPGILILIGVISVVGALTNEWKWGGEPEPELEPAEKRSRPVEAAPPPSPFAPAETPIRAEPAPKVEPSAVPTVRLPEFCPHCGAPTRALRYLAAQPDTCAFCGSGLVK